MRDAVLQYLQGQKDTVVAIQQELVSRNAVGPESGGPGECEKAEYITSYLEQLGITDIRKMNALDPRVPQGVRPNLAAIIPGENTDKTLWVIGHMDVVPAGNLELWSGDPFTLRVEDDMLLGRGVEDNHQGIVSSLLLASALKDLKITPPINFGLLFVADEETGNQYGMRHVVDKHAKLFGDNDLFLVPDSGTPEGDEVEIAEKSMLWLRIIVEGRQCHASRPEKGTNSLVAASDFVIRLRSLYDTFDARNDLFSPSISTFEATKKEANVENVNTIPGRDVFYLDCRVLPQYELDDVLNAVMEIAQGIRNQYGVSIDVETVLREQGGTPTAADGPVSSRLQTAIRDVLGIQPRIVGIGGGTVANLLRQQGHQATVWSRIMHNAHQPDEKGSIAFTLGDAQVFASILFA
jgi:succinyl-diaminopimelate desuccinylase